MELKYDFQKVNMSGLFHPLIEPYGIEIGLLMFVSANVNTFNRTLWN